MAAALVGGEAVEGPGGYLKFRPDLPWETSKQTLLLGIGIQVAG